MAEKRYSSDELAIDLTEVIPQKLTDILIKICRKKLETNRAMIDKVLSI